MRWSQIALGVGFTVYVVAFLAIAFAARRATGEKPVGRTGGHVGIALLNVVATALLPVAAASALLRGPYVPYATPATGLVLLVPGLGAVALGAADLLLVWSGVSLGRSFRVALPHSKQPLVTRGVYRVMRNPMALSVDLLALGMLLLSPGWVALVCFCANVVSYELKIRAEEAYLREEHGEAFVTYCTRTGRYGPSLHHLQRRRRRH